jgi:hypothetical protein
MQLLRASVSRPQHCASQIDACTSCYRSTASEWPHCHTAVLATVSNTISGFAVYAVYQYVFGRSTDDSYVRIAVSRSRLS